MNVRYLAYSLFFILTIGAVAQSVPVSQVVVEINLTTGDIVSHEHQRRVVFNEVIHIPDAPWLRLNFGEVFFGDPPVGGQEAVIRLTSVQDGAVQILNRSALAKWRNTSAYFNGDSLLVELISDPGSGASRFEIVSAWAGDVVQAPESICGPTDDRILSDDPRSARLMPIVCTAWLINDANKCFLTAGHCSGAADVVQFNVPLSSSTGTINHPPPQDQYPVDPASMQDSGSQAIGNDWAYFGTFPNTDTNLTAYEAQGRVAFNLAPPPADPAGQEIRITGFGVTAPPVPNEWSRAQKTHVGPLVFINPTTLNYQTDTTGSNSGSPVIHENTGDAIGIHTHAGCSATSGNNGTNIQHPDLVNALANPLGVCTPPPSIQFSFPDGLPEFLDPAGHTIRVVVSGIDGATVQSGSGMFHYDDGTGLISAAMNETSPNNYEAAFPPLGCGRRVEYEFTATTTGSTVVSSPVTSPERRYMAEVTPELNAVFADNFESDQGWAVENGPGLSEGQWRRGIPAGGGLRQDPRYDADGSGACFVTGNTAGFSDVDGGRTTLLSPVMDATQGDAHICYWRWFSNGQDDDTMIVDISEDGGATWTNLETLGPTGPDTQGGWIFRSFRIADFINTTNQFRIRFQVSDTGNVSIVEAGIDGVRLKRDANPYTCDTSCPGDLNLDGVVDNADLLIVAGAWGQSGGMGDLNGNGLVEIRDLLVLMELMGECL